MIIVMAFVLIIPSTVFAISDQNDEPTVYFRGNNGVMNSSCDNLAYNLMGHVNSESPTAFKVEIIDPNGKIIGMYEDMAPTGFDVQIDVDYNVEGIHLIHLHYNDKIYEEDYGWSKNYVPSRESQIQCLVAKEINNSDVEYQEINIAKDVRQTWKTNIEFLTNVLGQEKFEFYEPIINTDTIIDEQRKGINRVETNYAIEQLNLLRDILQNNSKEKLTINLEKVKEIISNMDELSTEEKIDTIYDTQLNYDESFKAVEFRNNKYIDDIIFQYRDLDRRDASNAEAERLRLEQQMEEGLAKQKILDEMNKSKDEIVKELNEKTTQVSESEVKSLEKAVSEPKKLDIASFVDRSKDPQHYIDRYNNEPEYKRWFDDNYPQYDSIEQAVGLELTEKIPDWVKNIFGWYAQDQVSEDELLNAIKYLINEKILIVN